MQQPFLYQMPTATIKESIKSNNINKWTSTLKKVYP